MKKQAVHVAGDKYMNAGAAAQIVEAIEELKAIGLSDVTDRDRPYAGQPWTSDGDRGRTLVEGVTMRDVRDCFILALFSSQPYGKPRPETVDDLDLKELSLEAVSQNLACWLERYMGIFPNLPGSLRGTNAE